MLLSSLLLAVSLRRWNPALLAALEARVLMFPTFRQTATQRRDWSTSDPRIDDRLNRATQQGDVDAVRHLLESGVDSNGVSQEGATALHIAARRGHLEIVKLLIQHGVEVDKVMEDKGTALYFAVREGRYAIVSYLLEEGADVEARCLGGETALAIGIHEHHIDVVRLLLDHGASHLVRAEDSLTALHSAAMNDDAEIARLLITRGANLHALNDEQQSPLNFAAQCGNSEIVRLLLDLGVQSNDSVGSAALRSAAANGHFEVVKLLLDRGADVRRVHLDAQVTPLHGAAKMGHLDVVRLLLERGADINAQAKDGTTPLHRAAFSGYSDTVSLLLDLGAVIDATARGGTPLHYVVRSDTKATLEILVVLLKRGANPRALDSDGLSVVQAARMRSHGSVPILQVLHHHLSAEILEYSMIPTSPGSTREENEEVLRDNERFSHMDDPADWERALTIGVPFYVSQVAIANTTESDFLSNIDHGHNRRTHNVNVTLKKHEVDLLINSGHPDIRTGILWLLRYEHITHSANDLESAMQNLRQCMFSHRNRHGQFGAARLYADLCLHYRDVAAAMRPLKFAMQLLQQIINPGQRVSMRYEHVPFVRDTVDAAVAAAIQDGDFVLAMEWFEQGRCIIWGQISRLHPPLDEIRANAPSLAEDMEAIIKEMSALEGLIEQRREYPGQEGAISHYQELSTRYETLVKEAQGISSLGGYMKPKSMHELKSAARHSHVVALNIAWWRCDALILRHESLDVIHVPLPKVSPGVLQLLFADFQQALKGAGLYTRSGLPGPWEDVDGSLEQVLSQLWEYIVEPVLTALGCMKTSSDHDLPRITWCASGLLAFLPLHAAGPYSEFERSRRSSALDLAIHSYVPSVTSLLNATRVHYPAERGAPTIFSVSQPATPHQVPISSTVTEVMAIQHVASSHGLTWLNDSAATTSAVLASMEEHAWVHLACHAVQDPLDPLHSAFLLHDGSLTLRSIMRLRFNRDKALAVLSACQTATGDSKVPDEAVHLAAGMFMAGFQNVVGTMWSIHDKDAPVFATAFYSYLVNEASGDSARTAQALHHAVRKLRDHVGESNFLKWVPFIHVGL